MTRDAAGMATPFIASAGVDPENLARFRDSAAEMDPHRQSELVSLILRITRFSG